MAVIDFFERGYRYGADADYLVFGERSYSYQEARDFTCRVANGLLAMGFRKETKAAVWAKNDPVGWLCTLSIWRAGMAWVPINYRNSTGENGYILEAFDCEVLFFQAEFAEQVASLRASLTSVRHYICFDGVVDWAISLEQWMAGYATTPPQITYDMADVCAVMATGGTTGKPKGVMNTHRSLSTMVTSWLAALYYPPLVRPVNLAAAPLTHTAGIFSLMAAARGGKLVILPRLEPDLLLDTLEQQQISELFLPPTVIYILLDHPRIKGRDFSALRYFLYGAAPMSVDKLKRALGIFGPVMIQGFGQTEAPACISCLEPAEHFDGSQIASDERLSSCGRPFPLVGVSIQNDVNTCLPQGEVGEICVQGDMLMKGYYKDAQKTAETIIDGWLHTGDVGFIDAAGYLHITDRKKDMIITGGFNVFSSEVEGAINSHPAVQDCAVVGVPDDKWGEAVKAVVELNPGASVSAEELITLCKDRLGSVKAPKTVEFIDKLPRSSVGKVLKRTVREKYWADKTKQVN
jgi:acyl-CoA synthetase (AMP-forming)/AMP-acid ligase II